MQNVLTPYIVHCDEYWSILLFSDIQYVDVMSVDKQEIVTTVDIISGKIQKYLLLRIHIILQ